MVGQPRWGVGMCHCPEMQEHQSQRKCPLGMVLLHFHIPNNGILLRWLNQNKLWAENCYDNFTRLGLSVLISVLKILIGLSSSY